MFTLIKKKIINRKGKDSLSRKHSVFAPRKTVNEKRHLGG
jgi:hypothetical protein